MKDMSFFCYWCEKEFPGEPEFTIDWPGGGGDDAPLCNQCGGDPYYPSIDQIHEKMLGDPLINAIEKANERNPS